MSVITNHGEAKVAAVAAEPSPFANVEVVDTILACPAKIVDPLLISRTT